MLIFLDNITESVRALSLGVNKALLFEALFYQWQQLSAEGGKNG